MPDHIKPTPEQLEEENKKILEDLNKPELFTETDEEEETPLEVKTTDEDVITDPPEDEGEKKVEVKIEEKTPEISEEEKVKIQLKESTKEAQRLFQNLTKVNKGMLDADNLPEPTEEDLKKTYPDWEDMSANEKFFAKETYINKQWRDAVKAAAQEQKKIVDWSEKVDAYVEDPKVLANNPELEGKTERFKSFASDSRFAGYDFNILVASFLHGLASQPNISHKGQKMFESGSYGPNEKIKPKDDKLSVEESATLQQTNYNLYKKKLIEGKIADVTV